MFNKDFFPTPREVVDSMLVGVDVKGKIVLEPSAGKGDIVDALFEYGASRVIACEINPDLAQIVAKKAQFLKADFLEVTAEEISHVDLIVMNPPFSADEKHITHAFEIMPKGCELVALCNSETIFNPFSQYRNKLKYLIEKNGYYSSLGKVFDTAERKSDVAVCLVRLFKKKDGSEQDEFEGYFDLAETVEYGEEGIMKHNEVREIVNRYVGAVKLFDEVLDHNIRMNQLIGKFPMSEYTHGGYDNELFKFGLSQKDKPIKREQFKIIVQKAAWKYVFAQMKMEKYMTQGVKQDINKFIEKQINVPFTMKNIFKMLEIIVGTSSSRFDTALLEVFDHFTKHTKENRFSVEGWATNSSYMFNRKIIINYVFSRESYKPGDEIGLQYSRNPAYLKFDDLVKVMCSISGTDWNSIGSFWDYYIKNGQYANRPALKTNTWYDFHFFRFKGFLKNTMHLEFKDEKLWCLLNQRVGELKGFVLPEEMKKKAKQKESEIKKDKFPGAEQPPTEPERLMIEAPKKVKTEKVLGKTDDVFVSAMDYIGTGKLLIEVTGNHKPHKEFIKSQGVKNWDGKNLRWWTKYGTPAQYEALMAYFGSGNQGNEAEEEIVSETDIDPGYNYQMLNRELLNLAVA